MLTLLFVVVVGILSKCSIRERMQNHDPARANADYIMNNLNKPKIIREFPEDYFPAGQMKVFLQTLTSECDLANKKGKFVDFFSMERNGESLTAYIYEYFLNCDSLRFIYIYNVTSKEPKLIKFRIEGLDEPNQMIVNPDKSLLVVP